MLVVVKKYKHYQSIITINEKMRKKGQPTFILHFVNLEDSLKTSDIPLKIIKENWDLIAYFILHNFNNALSSCEYPASLKYAKITAIFKKDDRTDKTNYRPINILSNLRKVFERFMQNQMYPYLNQIFWK